MIITSLDQLDENKTYTYADYFLWRLKERVELFKGKIFKMSPAPARIHQEILQNLNIKFYNYFQNQPCKVYFAPFDVRLPNKNGDIFTVVQPDLCVICDLTKLDDKGCLGAPDLIVEILSPGNTKKEMKHKYSIYEESGVTEYWLVHPTDKYIQVFVLKDGIYIGLRPMIEGDIITSTTFPELNFSTTDIFTDL
ncbi:Uma2 family endonuclease [Halpernia frigidisoli]|uniref:Endonuclease, Uma2 family (Restriction endonuclease fold) n=1 Tax=Halpernia frigidisoli TaxID=1125876 RepID=A0A1I3HMM3_9FLAO|nr:Uma2 family endonuclease [Halpernia frigidisoli]SFI36995.1 Endonuclease, Uma2 family (restriction endonuclease fold) [Halpernia frigidisoli]